MEDDDDIIDWFDYDDDCDIPDYDEEEDGYSMQIKLHGGACCGIKHIHGMDYSPECMKGAREALTGDNTSIGRSLSMGVNDAHADMYPQDFFNEAAPAERADARLDRLLKFLKKNRPHGIVEIVVTAGQAPWYPALEERGFKRVSTAKNSNTSNTLHVYHLCY